MRFVAKPHACGTGLVEDILTKRVVWFDSYTAAKEWAEIANRTTC